ncbi:SGNH/GDSL hydrolase family protein [Phycicoccus duodecadis]|uniref:Lysophospholipase L1-like esterase n=1 Tax=Phycicoccus duodecadis TaxID=173053 RepID=A0A2N3YEU1_9MICO|nr:SGNH/GDSL hydrolase family protein [Phycicoccus duodecadis]PKW25368.1 lysophospholipase L1-like esterase [Phycicoccus duodecadis]
MSASPLPLGYENRTGRGRGVLTRALGSVLPGVRRVNDQVEPYARAWTAHNTAALRTPGRRWVVLGDSMSQGVGASAWDAGWVDQLAGLLAARGHPLVVVNLSATGARTPDLLEQQLPVLRALPPAVGTDRPDLVTVMIGSNDLFAGPASRQGLPDAFAAMVAALPRGAVVATLPQPREAARLANRHLEDAAHRGDLTVVDLRTDGPSSWRGRLASDFFHPNDAGYAEMAKPFLPVVLRALESPGRTPASPPG